MTDWFSEGALAVLAAFSAVLFVAGAVGVPWVVTRLPEDYFISHHDFSAQLRPSVRIAYRLGKNALGVLLAIAGIAMLVFPGPGLLTLFVAVSLLDFPGKRRLVRRIASVPPVLRGINRLRRRMSRPPLRFE